MPEICWIHYAFDLELIFGSTFRNLFLLSDFHDQSSIPNIQMAAHNCL